MSESDKPITNQEEHPALEELDKQGEESVEEPEVYVCSVEGCGKTFDNPNSLKMHQLRSHRISPHEEKRERKPPAERKVAEPTFISTEADMLRDILKAVKFNKIEAAVKLCDSYGYTVDSIYQALKELGAPISIIRPTISWWSSYHDEYIPPSLARELQMPQPRVYPRRRTWYERGYPPGREEVEGGGGLLHGMAAVLREMRESEGVKADPQLMREIGALETRVEQLLNRPVDTGNSKIVSSLSNQVSELSKKLEEEKEKRLMDRFDSLEKRMEDISRNADREPLTAAIHELGDMVKTFIKGVTIGFPSESPPKREKIEKPKGAPTIEEMVRETSPELIEE